MLMKKKSLYLVSLKFAIVFLNSGLFTFVTPKSWISCSKNSESIFRTSNSVSVTGMKGGTTSFMSNASQSIPLKNGCYLISVAPDSQQPILSSGSGFSSFKSKSAASTEQ